MAQTVEILESLLMFLIAEAADENGGGFLMICLTALSFLAFEDDLHKIRPSNLYPPAGFYPSGSLRILFGLSMKIFFSSNSGSGWNIFIKCSLQ